MAVVVLRPQYVKKLAQSYRLLKTTTEVEPKVLLTLLNAARRCLLAHTSGELQLASDVRLPYDVVVRMLQDVEGRVLTRLHAVQQPEPAAFAAAEPADAGNAGPARPWWHRFLGRFLPAPVV